MNRAAIPPPRTSHVSALPPDTVSRRPPSGDHAASSASMGRSATACPVSTSTTRARRSRPPTAMRAPSGLNRHPTPSQYPPPNARTASMPSPSSRSRHRCRGVAKRRERTVPKSHLPAPLRLGPSGGRCTENKQAPPSAASHTVTPVALHAATTAPSRENATLRAATNRCAMGGAASGAFASRPVAALRRRTVAVPPTATQSSRGDHRTARASSAATGPRKRGGGALASWKRTSARHSGHTAAARARPSRPMLPTMRDSGRGPREARAWSHHGTSIRPAKMISQKN